MMMMLIGAYSRKLRTPKPGFFRLIPYTPIPLNRPRCPRIPPADRIDLCVADIFNRQTPHKSTTLRRAMQPCAGHNRRGAKARRLNKQPIGMPPSPELPRESSPRRPNAQGHQGQTNLKQAIQPARSTPSWAKAIGRPQTAHKLVPHRTPTYHTVAKDADYHHPFESLPHLLLTGRYSGSTLPWKDMVFRNVFPTGRVATRELL
jgi:hypothetical protein